MSHGCESPVVSTRKAKVSCVGLLIPVVGRLLVSVAGSSVGLLVLVAGGLLVLVAGGLLMLVAGGLLVPVARSSVVWLGSGGVAAVGTQPDASTQSKISRRKILRVRIMFALPIFSVCGYSRMRARLSRHPGSAAAATGS